MFSISTTLVQLSAVLAAVVTLPLGALAEFDCYYSGHLYLGVIEGVNKYISSPSNYFGNNIYAAVDKPGAAEFVWNICAKGGSNIELMVSIFRLE